MSLDREPDPTDLLSHSPSDELTRARRHLLAMILVGYLIGYVGVVPAKLSVLGLEFGPIDPSAFVWLAFGVLVFSAAAFVIALVPDRAQFCIKKSRFAAALTAFGESLDDETESQRRDYYRNSLDPAVVQKAAPAIASAYGFWLYLIPVLLAMHSGYLLLAKVWAIACPHSG